MKKTMKSANPSGKLPIEKPEASPARLRIVGAPDPQNVEEIAREEPEETRVPRVHDNPVVQKADVIVGKLVSETTNMPRLANGFKIVDNRAYQRIQKIKPVALTIQADDEIGYKKLFTRFEEAFTIHDMAAIADCLSPSFQWHLPNGHVVYGKKEALEEMERRFAMANGPKFSALVWRFKDTTVIQTYDVEYMGPDGRWRQSKGLDIYEIGGGLITKKDAYWKMIP